MDDFAMHRAAQDGDIEKVKHFIQKGMSVDCLDNNKYTPLHWAATCGHLEVVKFLIFHKSDLNLKAKGGSTAVLLAAECKHKNIVELLLGSGADANGCSEIGKWTILHHASRGGWTDVVKRIVKNRNAQLNAETTLGMGPLLLAACEGHPDVVELLIQAGANVNCRDTDSWTILHYASQRGWFHIVKKILEIKEYDVDAKTSRGMSPLLLAACEGHTDVIELLIEAGANVNCRDADSWTVLHYASKKGWLQIVTKIGETKKFYINVKNSDGNTPLHIACGMHNTGIVKELLKLGADARIINKKNEKAFSGKTMHDAAITGDIEEMERLIKLGMSIESRDHIGYTPLHHAAENDNIKVAKFLIHSNCNLNPKADGKETPLLVAGFHDNADIVNLLIQSGADISCCANWTKTTILHTAIKNGWKDTVRCILKRNNFHINAKTNYGWTPLMYAVDTGHLDLTKLLLEAGANVHGCDDEGETALHLACNEDDVDVELVKTLLLAGADANLKNSDNETAFHYAVEQEEPCLEVIKLLIQHGAYFRYSDSVKISKNNPLKELVLKDVELCTQLIINKFNRQSLPVVYKNPEFVEKLPRIYTLNISNTQGVGSGIEDCVESEIGAKTFCDVMKVRPIVLTLMCVESLISPQTTKKKTSARQVLHNVKGSVKRSARLALLNTEAPVKKQC